MTKQRQAIYDIIQNSPEHMTAEQIYTLTKQALPSVVVATVYNNLNSMVDKGLIMRIKVPGHADHFDRGVIPHEHLICKHCGKLYDAKLGDLKAEFERRCGVLIESYDLSLYFICDECRSDMLQKGGYNEQSGNV
ncbi:MAG: transcriptional repressor [Lachnospiraceae bacterium]|nr:transcriptional repressor [Lachnospiraceae bacterium]